MGQIKSYPSDSTPVSADRFLFQDGASDAYKQISFSDLKAALVGAAWTSWTPTLANMSLGNGTLACKYVQAGKIVIATFRITLGTTSTVGTNPTFTLPVTASRDGYSAVGYSFNAGVTRYPILCFAGSTTVVEMYAQNVGGTYLSQDSITSTAPHTHGTSDQFEVTIVYEGA